MIRGEEEEEEEEEAETWRWCNEVNGLSLWEDMESGKSVEKMRLGASQGLPRKMSFALCVLCFGWLPRRASPPGASRKDASEFY